MNFGVVGKIESQRPHHIIKKDVKKKNNNKQNRAMEEEKVENVPTVPALPLTQELVGQHISLLAKTGNGLSHAYTRLEVRGKGVTNIDVLESYPHLRYLVNNPYKIFILIFFTQI